MRRTTILNAVQVKRTTLTEAENAFYKHCKLKNLRPRTINYYKEDLTCFHGKTAIKYMDEVTQEVFEAFLLNELEAGKKQTSLNTRIRGLRVFFSFCAEREYMQPVTLKLMKVDEEIKEPYTEAELKKLLKRPTSNRWAEWRAWAAINYLISTGNRVSTVVGLKIEDVDFDEMTIEMPYELHGIVTAYRLTERCRPDAGICVEKLFGSGHAIDPQIIRKCLAGVPADHMGEEGFMISFWTYA